MGGVLAVDGAGAGFLVDGRAVFPPYGKDIRGCASTAPSYAAPVRGQTTEGVARSPGLGVENDHALAKVKRRQLRTASFVPVLSSTAQVPENSDLTEKPPGRQRHLRQNKVYWYLNTCVGRRGYNDPQTSIISRAPS